MRLFSMESCVIIPMSIKVYMACLFISLPAMSLSHLVVLTLRCAFRRISNNAKLYIGNALDNVDSLAYLEALNCPRSNLSDTFARNKTQLSQLYGGLFLFRDLVDVDVEFILLRKCMYMIPVSRGNSLRESAFVI